MSKNYPQSFKTPNGNGWFAEVPVNLPENLKRRVTEGPRACSWKVRVALLLSPHHLRVRRPPVTPASLCTLHALSQERVRRRWAQGLLPHRPLTPRASK